MQVIRNHNQLNTSPAHADMLTIIEAGLDAVNVNNVLAHKMSCQNEFLSIGNDTYNLNEYRRVVVIGAGKMAAEIASTLESILGSYVTEGVVVGLAPKNCEVILVRTGTHPQPNVCNVGASDAIARLARSCTEHDLVIVAIAGGGSSLLCWPFDECEQSTKLYQNFLASGATINELNTVRKHLSGLKGGGLVKLLCPATVIGLIFSDTPGLDPSMVASGPTYFDPTTKADAQKIITQYQLGSYQLRDTPKDHRLFAKVKNYVCSSNLQALQAMSKIAAKLGYNVEIYSQFCYDNPKQLAHNMLDGLTTKQVRLAGGEVTTRIPKEIKSQGGRCSHTALCAIQFLSSNTLFSAVATDGNDNGYQAGALVDSHTSIKLIDKGFDIKQNINNFTSGRALQSVQALIETGPLPSNVSDLFISMHS